MANNVEISILLDLYGDALTEKQRLYVDNYYNNDLSLSEIAENEGITRQGVRDAIKRAEALLYDMEQKLHFSERMETVKKSAEKIINLADGAICFNSSHGNFEEINEYMSALKSAAQLLTEQEGITYGI